MEKDFRRSERVSSGHQIHLLSRFRDAPICPYHAKKAIICEPYDQLGSRMCFCIDCIAKALYELPRLLLVYEKVLGRKITKEEIKKVLYYDDQEAEMILKSV